MAEQKLQELLKNIEESFFNIETKTESSNNFGVIRSYKDGVIEIEGLKSLKMGEIVSIQSTQTKALILNLEKNLSYALTLQNNNKIKAGMYVESTGKTLEMPVSEKLIGRVVDSLGNPLDGKGEIKAESYYPHEKIAPGVITRKSVHQPLQTGIIAIDTLIPIGRGQRELIIGDRQTGKTAIAIDTIINQKGQDIKCIYVAIGQKESKVASIYNQLEKSGALDYTIIVSATAATSAVMQFLAPYAGSAIAEYFLSKGEDALIIYDDLSKHAVSYREMSLLLKRSPGREAYPGDVFYIHSRLLERAVKLNEKNGGGSITALPIIETQAGDVSAYIPTNVISITDGQIFLDTDLYNKGIFPAINVGISVSRVGGAAQTKIMKKVSGTMKLDLASYYELEAFSQFASDLDENTKRILKRGKRVVLSLTQKQNAPYQLWEEVLIAWGATNGYLDNLEENEVRNKLSSLLSHIKNNMSNVASEISKKKELTDEIKVLIDNACKEFFN